MISIDLYQQDLLVCFGSRFSLVRALSPLVGKRLAREEAKAIGHSSQGRTVIDEERGVYYLWLPQRPESAAHFGVLAHEVAHVAFGLMQKIGASLTPESEEAYTYLIHFLTERICAEFGLMNACRAPLRWSKDAS